MDELMDDLEPFTGEPDWELAFAQNPDEPPCCELHEQMANEQVAKRMDALRG